MRLIPLLSAAQHEHGYLSEATLRELSQAHTVPLHRLQQLVSFYPHFRTTPPPRVELAVCRDMSCWLAGGEEFSRKLHELKATDVEVREVSCVGRCDRAPAAAINGVPVPAADVDQVHRWVADPTLIPDPRPGDPRHWACDPYPTTGERYATLVRLRRLGPRVRDQ